MFNNGAAGGFNKRQFVEGPDLLDSEVPAKKQFTLLIGRIRIYPQ
jgi:hypothetical protein